MESIFENYLEKINQLERDAEAMTTPEFDELKKAILSRLNKGHRMRFSRLKFYYYENNDFLDDIPF
ncbi:MAG: hypothetical protein ACLPSL_04875 [Smithella sp.]